jgi:hypothetical protein
VPQITANNSINEMMPNIIYVNILTHFTLSLQAFHHELTKKYKANPKNEKNKIPLRIYTRSEGSSSSSSSDAIVINISVLLSIKGNEA